MPHQPVTDADGIPLAVGDYVTMEFKVIAVARSDVNLSLQAIQPINQPDAHPANIVCDSRLTRVVIKPQPQTKLPSIE